MAWSDLFAALGLVLILEGILPFLNPKGWKETLAKVFQMDDRQLRFVGLTLIMVGLIILNWVR